MFGCHRTKGRWLIELAVSKCMTVFGYQGSHRLEKYLNLEDFLEKSLKMKSAFKSTGKSLKSP